MTSEAVPDATRGGESTPAPIATETGPIARSLEAVREAIAGIDTAKEGVERAREDLVGVVRSTIAPPLRDDPEDAVPRVAHLVHELYWQHLEVRLADIAEATGLTTAQVREVAGPRIVEVDCTDCGGTTSLQWWKRRATPSGTCGDCLEDRERSLQWPGSDASPDRWDTSRGRMDADRPGLRDLVDHLAIQVPRLGCGHDLAMTERWALREGLFPASVRDTVQSFGAWCDCEVVLNLGRGSIP